MSLVKVLIVDDSVLARRMISSALEVESFVQIVGSAVNGRNALQKIEQLNPDIVVMDLEMPEMDGIEALKIIKETYPRIAVIMFSSISDHMTERTIEALELGAADFVSKPSGTQSIDEVKMLIRSSLVPKIKALHAAAKKHAPVQAEAPPPVARTPRPAEGPAKPFVKSEPAPARPKAPLPAVHAVPERPGEPIQRKKRYPIEVLAIGVSTGGPNALSKLMPTIPKSIPVPIVIVQHMPATFTATLARRLDAVSELDVREGQPGEILKPGTAWIAPGGVHMVVEKTSNGVELQTNMDPPEQGCRPAVDVLFRSVARVYGKNTLAVILTGMGKDGLDGSQDIIDLGGALLAQDEASSVVWGMPGAVTKAGLPDKVVPIDRMGYEIMLRIDSTNLIHSTR